MEEAFDALRRKYPDRTHLQIAQMISDRLLPHRTRNTIYQRYRQVKSDKSQVLEDDMGGIYHTGSPSRPTHALAEYRRRDDRHMIAQYVNSTGTMTAGKI